VPAVGRYSWTRLALIRPNVCMANDVHAPASAAELEVFKVVADHFRQDLREYWVRNNMYLVVNGILISVYTSAVSDGAYRLALPAFGLLTSAFWFAVARGSYHWLRVWRHELCEIDVAVDPFKVFHRVEQERRHRLRSPSWVTQWLPLVVGLGWLVILGIGVATG
jgi:hypothetical protein